MSLFPIRLKPGGTITVHLRWYSKFTMWLHRKDFLIDPNGKKTLCYERLLPFIPQSSMGPDDYDRIHEAGQIYGGAPLLMAARYLQNEFYSTEHFLNMLVGLRDETHHFYTLTLPDDAPLGRYQFDLEDRVNGKVYKSCTGDTDYFLVEQLKLLKVEKLGTQWLAHIENPSPEAVLGQLCQVKVGFEEDVESKVITFEAQSVTQVPFEDAGMLLYRDGDEVLRLFHEKEKSCLRNPTFQSLLKENFTMIFSNDPARKEAFELEGETEKIWKLANGFFPKSQVRRADNASLYDEMLEMGMIQEID